MELSDFLPQDEQELYAYIGETTSRILKEDSAFAPNNARKVVNLRNHVIHGYDKNEEEIIWVIVVKYLPRLREDIDRLLG